MRYGDSGKRIVACIIDQIILLICYFLIIYALAPALGLNMIGSIYGWSVYMSVYGWKSLLVIPLVIWLFNWMYYTLFEGGGWHATIGKKIMGLYVGDSDGNGITYSVAILRLIGKVVSRLCLGIGFLMGFFNENKQCLHDMIAKTYVYEGDGENVRPYGRKAAGAPGVRRSAGGTGRELVAVNGPLAGTIYEIDENGLLLGRDNISCQVVIPSTQGKISRMHCFVTYNPMSDMFVLNDRNSTHGTFLANGTKLVYGQPAALKSGEKFYLATPDNMFEVR